MMDRIERILAELSDKIALVESEIEDLDTEMRQLDEKRKGIDENKRCLKNELNQIKEQDEFYSEAKGFSEEDIEPKTEKAKEYFLSLYFMPLAGTASHTDFKTFAI